MTDGLSMVLIQWSELDRKLSEFREIITEGGNDMNVTAGKKLLSDLQLEWEELDKKTNTSLHYERQINGVLNISYPPVSLSNCIRSNDSTHWISQSNFGMASEDPLSLSTVCDQSHGDNHSSLTRDNQTDEKTLMSCYFTHYTDGGISQNIRFSSRIQTRLPAGPYQDSNEMVWAIFGVRGNTRLS
jgi:hypothetical protein